MRLPLYDLFPSLENNYPALPIGNYPTPVRRLSNLEKFLKTSVELWVKSDDKTNPILGGSKIRKLEFLLGNAKRLNKTKLIAHAAEGSNYLLSLALFGKQFNFDLSFFTFRQPETERVRQNREIFHNLKIPVRDLNSPLISGIVKTWQDLFTTFGNSENLVLPYGGSDLYGMLGMINSALELSEQIKNKELPEPDLLFLPCGTLGTYGGLYFGLKLSGIKARLIGINVVSRIITNSFAAKMKLSGLKKFLSPYFPKFETPFFPKPEIIHDYIGRGYGFETKEGVEAVKLLKEKESIILDTTYSGKTMACLIDFIKTQEIEQKNNSPLKILFWNTFGTIGEKSLL